MHVELSDDQEFFRETTHKFLAAESPLTSVRALEAHADGFEASYWRRGAELGWTSMLVPERDGGGSLSGAGLCDLALVAEEMGRLVAPGPLVPVSVVADAIARLGSEAQRGDVLGGIVSGETIGAWAFNEPGMRCDTDRIALTAELVDDGFVLVGDKSPIEAGAQADVLVVTARLADENEGPTGPLAQFLVPATADGITISPLDNLDLNRRFASIQFDHVAVPTSCMLGEPGAIDAEIERQLLIALVLQCAETCGAIAQVFEFTVEYLGDRFSFGRPLSSYQALKHRIADMKMWLEACHATTDAAAHAVNAGSDDAAMLASAAKAYVGHAASEIVQDCVQLHGGIGVTWEHDLHIYLRRVTTNHGMYGSPKEHLARVADGLAFTPHQGVAS